MNIALVDSNPKSKRYNVGLLRIGSLLKSKGHICKLYQNCLPVDTVDETWISTVFTFNIPHSINLARKASLFSGRVLIGGIAATLMPEEFDGFEVYRGLMEEAERYPPDYSLLKETPKYSTSTTSRGCIRNCKFCMVRIAEPNFTDRPNWESDIHRASTQVIFYDNNFLAKPKELLYRDFETLRKICASGRIRTIDFNQALDCRLMTDEYAEQFSGIPLYPVRFAFDNMSEDGHFQSAIEKMMKNGFVKYMIYVLWNFKDTPQDFYYRLKETHRLAQKYEVRVVAFPMRYQPILQVDESRNYVGENWTESQKKAFSLSMMYIGATHGQMSLFGKRGIMTPVENFEFWYGRTGEEFFDILSVPNAKEHWRFKQGILQAGFSDTKKPKQWADFWSEIT